MAATEKKSTTSLTLVPEPSPDLVEVQERVDRLEEAVAVLCDTDTLEERVAERIAQKLTMREISLPPLPNPAALPGLTPVSEPLKVQPVPLKEAAPLATFAEFSLPPAHQPLAEKPKVSLSASFWSLLPQTSLLRDIAWDGRTLYRLWRDPGYLSTWSFRTLPILILLFVFLWPKLSPYLGWLVPQVSLGLIGMFLDVVLLYLAFKIIQRELRRYDEFAAKYRR